MVDKVCCHSNTAVGMLASYSVLPRAIQSDDLYIFEVLRSLVSVITEKLPLFSSLPKLRLVHVFILIFLNLKNVEV